MSKYIQATAKKPFFCAWKCCSCGTINVERPEASAYVRENVTIFVKEPQAREKARAKAGENLDKLMENIPTFVNEKLNYNSLTKCGTCRHCSTQQPWAKQTNYMLYASLAVVALVAALLIIFEALRECFPLVLLGGIFAFLGAIWLGETLNTRARRNAAMEMTDDLCRPLAITSGIPETIKRDDPRLVAIINAIVEKEQA